MAFSGTTRFSRASAAFASSAAQATPPTAGASHREEIPGGRRPSRLLLMGIGWRLARTRVSAFFDRAQHFRQLDAGADGGRRRRPQHRYGGDRRAIALRLVYARIAGGRALAGQIGEGVDRFGKPTPCSAQPMHGWPVPTGQDCHADVAEQDGGTIGVGLWAFAAELVEAIALAMTFVAEFQREASSVEMGPPFAIFMHQPAKANDGRPSASSRRQFAEGQEVNDAGEEIVGIGRTAREWSRPPCPAHRRRPLAPVGFGRRGRHATPGGARADGDHRRGIGGALLSRSSAVWPPTLQ